MTSIRKRIGYLPSINAQESITKIAKKEKLSQSKVVGILVEEALLARISLDIPTTNDLSRKSIHAKEINMDNTSIKYNELDELISDKGITYNSKKYKYNLENHFSEPKEKYNEELFEKFKQFILFQDMINDKY
tara:strand:- start:177 stop:575 length:399 start_codon:yes stop_codon:yes gene_type:complete